MHQKEKVMRTDMQIYIKTKKKLFRTIVSFDNSAQYRSSYYVKIFFLRAFNKKHATCNISRQLTSCCQKHKDSI